MAGNTALSTDQTNKMFLLLSEQAPICMAWVEPGMKIAWANAACRDYTGKPMDEPWPICDCIHGEDAEKMRNALRKVFEQPRRIQEELRFLRHDGEYRWFRLVGSPIMEEATVAGIVAVLSDITDQVIVEEQMLVLNDSLEEMVAERTRDLKRANRELKQTQSQMLHHEKMASIGQLAAGVAHEINNPIGFIASNLNSLGKYMGRLNTFIKFQDQLVRDHLDDEGQELLRAEGKKQKIDYLLQDGGELIAESLDGANRVQEIVRNLKSFSRIDQAAADFADINECLENTIAIAWNELKYKITLERDFGELPPLECHPRQLNQVFMNLLVNGAQAIEEKGVIKIKTWHNDKYIFVQIADNGCGIPEENLTRIFEPFFTTKKVGEGTGLGMSISYDIVKAHQGDILVESSVGAGTIFLVQLPFKTEVDL
jgi:two-component system NtrC family sensor kinase